MKERSGAKEEDIVGKQRAGRVKAFTDDRECTRERERRARAGELERRKERRKERKHDEGFTAAVMFVGSRNFGVSESGEESYLNEPG